MKTLFAMTFVALAFSASIAQADETVGRVRGIYFEVARGVLMDRPVTRSSATRWADIELDAAVPAERRHVLVQVPREIATKVGDLAGVELASASLRTEAIPIQRVNHVTEVRTSEFAVVRGLSNFGGLR